jgi:hypothetical protein
MMKKLKFILILFLIWILAGCSKDETQIQEPEHQIDINSLIFAHSMKGWELYSWHNGNDWNYSILIGTDRLKTYDEVTKNEIVVTGKDSLKMVLDRFPAGETITLIGRGWLERCWGGNFNNLSLPPKDIIDEIKQYCSNINLILQITE